MRRLLLVLLALVGVGCEGFSIQPKSQPTPPDLTANHPHFEIHSSPNETFLLDTHEGKVWKYDSKQGAFVQLSVKTDETKPDAKDPLGLFDDKKDEKKRKPDCAANNLSFEQWRQCRDAGAYKNNQRQQ